MKTATPENRDDRQPVTRQYQAINARCRVKGCVWRGVCPVHDEHYYTKGFHDAEVSMRHHSVSGGTGRQIQCDYCGRWVDARREHDCGGAA